jgi:uncharacterized protein YjhX (UPF0386 family)
MRADVQCCLRAPCAQPHQVFTSMDISREEQRVLHVLAQGGIIEPLRNARGRIENITCINRDGFMLPNIGMPLFKKLKRRHTIASQKGGPYRITRRGLELVRSEVDNR